MPEEDCLTLVEPPLADKVYKSAEGATRVNWTDEQAVASGCQGYGL